MAPKWLALESNPEVMNDYAYSLGMSKKFSFQDIYGFDEDMLSLLPERCLAVLLIFPINKKSEEFHEREQVMIEMNRRENVFDHEKVYFMKQTVGNACGTVGVLHAILNNREDILDDEEVGGLERNYFEKFYEKTKDMTADERAKYVEEDEDLESYHANAVEAGQSEVPTIDEDIQLHFICFVEREGRLYELDGRKKQAIDHGLMEKGMLLKTAVDRVINGFLERSDNSIQFGACALCETPPFDDSEAC